MQVKGGCKNYEWKDWYNWHIPPTSHLTFNHYYVIHSTQLLRHNSFIISVQSESSKVNTVVLLLSLRVTPSFSTFFPPSFFPPPLILEWHQYCVLILAFLNSLGITGYEIRFSKSTTFTNLFVDLLSSWSCDEY